MRLGVFALAALACGCGGPALQDAGTSTGVDEALSARCLVCHGAVATQWAQPSSHRLLFDCGACHTARGPDGSRHMSTASCTACHSQALHHSVACGACHDVHGAENLALLRPALGRFRVAQGLAPDGLAWQGEGVCERCHTTTAFYRVDGGRPHDTAWCITCHSHQGRP